MSEVRDTMREWVPHYERKVPVDEDDRWVVHEFEPNGLGYYAATYRNEAIATSHVGTIAFQGTEAEIAAMIRRTFGVDAKPGV